MELIITNLFFPKYLIILIIDYLSRGFLVHLGGQHSITISSGGAKKTRDKFDSLARHGLCQVMSLFGDHFGLLVQSLCGPSTQNGTPCVKSFKRCEKRLESPKNTQRKLHVATVGAAVQIPQISWCICHWTLHKKFFIAKVGTMKLSICLTRSWDDFQMWNQTIILFPSESQAWTERFVAWTATFWAGFQRCLEPVADKKDQMNFANQLRAKMKTRARCFDYEVLSRNCLVFSDCFSRRSRTKELLQAWTLLQAFTWTIYGSK